MSYLPENYVASRETTAFQQALQPEVELIWETRDSLLAQLSPYTADWGLDYWEKALGLGSCQEFSLDTRRRQIVAKLQGRETTTPAAVKAVAETLLGVPVKVVEIFGAYRVELEVNSGGKLPAGVEALKRRLGEIMPAHLGWGLVIPVLARVPILGVLGPRVGRGAPPVFRPRLPVGSSRTATLMGTRRSTIRLPMAAAEEV